MPKSKTQTAIDDAEREFEIAQYHEAMADSYAAESPMTLREIQREQIAEAQRRQPFIDFVIETLGIQAFDFSVLNDYEDGDGWRYIDIKCFPFGQDEWLSTIYLAPGLAGRFPLALDIPF